MMLILNLGWSGHKYIRPKAIHDDDIVNEYSKDYMYLACIKFINAVSIRDCKDVRACG